MAVLLLREAVKYVRTVYLARRGQACFVKLLEECSDALLRAKLDYHRQNNRGVLHSRLFNDTRYAGQLFQIGAEYAISFLLALAYLTVMGVISWKLTLFLLPVFALVRFGATGLSRNASRAGVQVSENYAALSRGVNELLQNIAFLKSRCAETASLQWVGRLAGCLSGGLVYQEKLKAAAAGISQPMLFLGTLLGIYFAVETIGLRIAELAMFVFVLTRLIALSSNILALGVQYTIGMQSFQALNELKCGARAAWQLSHGTKRFVGLRNAIALKNVGFSYPASASRAIADVSLIIPKGQFVALVGRSGAGKSTVAGLIGGFFEPSDGTIFFDDTPVNDFEVASLRRRISFVEQDPVMFDESIRTNLAFGLSPPPTEAMLLRALQRVHAVEFVNGLAQGLDTIIGERGARVSGGQRQRLALARALCADPDVLILDEPTSALDPESDLAIRQALMTLKGEITTIVIAHRPSTVRDADCIYCLEAGRIVDRGTFSELTGRSEAFERVFGRDEQRT